MNNELLFNEIYERTKDFGRTHFVREITRLQIENQQLKDKLKWYEKENAHNQEIIIKQESTIKKIKHILNNQMDYREFVNMINDIEDVLKESE